MGEQLLRSVLAKILPYPTRFRLSLLGAKMARPLVRFVPDARLRAMIKMAPKQIPAVSRNDDPQVFPPKTAIKKRVALMTGCAQRALNTDINDATIRVLQRFGCEVVIADGQGCCGALTHHMGKVNESHASAAKNIAAWHGEIENGGLDAIVVNTSGCGTTVKDYGHMFRDTPLADKAAKVSEIAKDISEVLVDLDIPEQGQADLRVAYHAACSLQHGQKIKDHPKALLRKMGFEVVEPKDAHLCCGSAGTYNLMQPEISGQLKANKLRNLIAKSPDVIAAGNIGCMMQLGSDTKVPVLHTVELIDWATGGPKPTALNVGTNPQKPEIPILR
jgi:glycolate oxidase iron-sulfur subunit